MVDACSPGDLAVASAAGIQPARVSYAGHSMADRELDVVAEEGVFFIADSLSQLDRYGQRRPLAAVGLRVNVGVSAGFHPHVAAGAHTSKFGIHPSQLSEAKAIAATHGLRITCLHTHIGSELLDDGPHLAALHILLDLSRELKDITSVNLGGGWGTPVADAAPYDLDAFGAAATVMLRDRPAPLELRIEPGAGLVMQSGALLTTVTEIKPSVVIEDESTPTFVGVDCSHNQLVSAVIYDTPHRILVADRPNAPPTQTCDVVGHLMQAGDVLGRSRPMPSVDVGDVLAIGRVGGYSSCRATTFNERPVPAEVLVLGDEAQLVRRAGSIEGLLASDVPWKPPIAPLA